MPMVVNKRVGNSRFATLRRSVRAAPCTAARGGLESAAANRPPFPRGQCVMNDSQGTRGGGISRRAFLSGSGAAAAATALAQQPAERRAVSDTDAAGAVAIGPGPVKLDLTVNGSKV